MWALTKIKDIDCKYFWSLRNFRNHRKRLPAKQTLVNNHADEPCHQRLQNLFKVDLSKKFNLRLKPDT